MTGLLSKHKLVPIVIFIACLSLPCLMLMAEENPPETIPAPTEKTVTPDSPADGEKPKYPNDPPEKDNRFKFSIATYNINGNNLDLPGVLKTIKAVNADL
ncbi:MAG TPA: hypothetical protein ENL03_03635, partial [Phycisphaerae bacterium]|nr:hypothetical protein [Phycisphaerae bacterium]